MNGIAGIIGITCITGISGITGITGRTGRSGLRGITGDDGIIISMGLHRGLCETVPSADLGGSSNYSNENFED